MTENLEVLSNLDEPVVSYLDVDDLNADELLSVSHREGDVSNREVRASNLDDPLSYLDVPASYLEDPVSHEDEECLDAPVPDMGES